MHGIQLCELGRDYLPLFHLRFTLLQAVIQGSACCAHWTGQTCADKIQLEVRTIQALTEYFFSSSLHPKVCMLRALNRSDMGRQDSARSACEYFSSLSLYPKVGMLCTLNWSDMCRQDSARSAQCSCSTWIFPFFKRSSKGRHAARTEPVRHAQTRFS